MHSPMMEVSAESDVTKAVVNSEDGIVVEGWLVVESVSKVDDETEVEKEDVFVEVAAAMM